MASNWNRSVRRGLVTTIGTLAVLGSVAAPASAAEGRIDHVETGRGTIRVLYSVPGVGKDVKPDLTSVTATINGTDVEAEAALAGDSKEGVARTSILAIDVSQSMRGERIVEAKQAAQTYLETAPVDVLVGIVTFAGDVNVVQEPTLDRAASIAVLEDLELSLETRLYDGIQQAVRTAGDDGQRSVLVLSDGRDTSTTPLDDVTAAIKDSEIQVDVVAVGQSEKDRQPLEQVAEAGAGSVLTADDPAALSEVFASEAQALAKQVLVTVTVPADMSASEGTLALSIDANGETYLDSAFVTVQGSDAPTAPAETPALKAPSSAFAISETVMLAGLAAAAVGGLIVLLAALGVFAPKQTQTLEDRIAAYSLAGGQSGGRLSSPRRPETVAGSAVGIAQKALASNKGFESALGARLEAAGMSIRPAEWLLAHAGFTLGAGIIAFLLSSGNALFTVVLLAVGAVLPYLYLGIKRSRRVKTFNGQLPDTLQLMSGSLSAGLSLAQSVDTVVREGSEPMAGEFRRALVEARLGVQIEDALDSVAGRMQSDDFRWVVMAIKIQREVGGNLAELLLQVAATMREREYLRRQVKTLSAEGRMSAWILGGLPPIFLVYLMLVRRAYLEPMLTTTLGWVMFGVAGVLMAIGAFWMGKVVKVEV